MHVTSKSVVQSVVVLVPMGGAEVQFTSGVSYRSEYYNCLKTTAFVVCVCRLAATYLETVQLSVGQKA